MSLRNACRSYGILLIIASAFIDDFSTNAFTIRRTNSTAEYDQEFAESSLSEIKTEIKPIEVNVVGIAKNDTNFENNVSVETTTEKKAKENGFRGDSTESSTVTPDNIDGASNDKGQLNIEHTSLINITINAETTKPFNDSSEQLVSTNQPIETTKVLLQITTEIPKTEEKLQKTYASKNSSRRDTGDNGNAAITENEKLQLIFDTKNETSSSMFNKTTTNNTTDEITAKIIRETTINETEVNNVSYSIPSVMSNESTPYSVEVNTDDSTQSILEMTQTTSKPVPTTIVNNVESTTGNSQTTESTEMKAAQFKMDTIIAQKDHTILDRKHITLTQIDVSTENIKEFSKTDTDQSTVNLEMVFTELSPQQVMKELIKNDLLPIKNNRGNENESKTFSSSTEQYTNTVTEIHTIQTNVSNSISAEPTTETIKLDTVTSKRGGYLDFSLKTTSDSKIEVINSTKNKVDSSDNITDVHESVFGVETILPYDKNVGTGESQSQLIEDTIKEELLKEATLNDNAGNEQYREFHENLTVKELQPMTKDGVQEENSKQSTQETMATNQMTATEDKLSVKALSPENMKNASLYTVNPNYKPLKKIDIQPPKPFVRDPDDNSWRNESLSSLGIVFKPKNTSKSFTQVLKNKTVFELNNLLERESNEMPELRQRLEKISEKRKSKKKNNLGETIYSDEYEENVSDMNTNKPAMNMSTSTIQASLSTAANKVLPVDKPVTKQVNTTESVKTDTPTTENIKKFYNILEYYDVTDEDDDYDAVTLPKIDLKKYTTPFRENEAPVTPAIVPLTQAMTVQFPDRKPTIQYFPPRLQQKIESYDSVFEKKVNLFTLKDTTKNFPMITYGTKPTPTQNDRQQTRLNTLKPIDFTKAYNKVDLNRHLYLTLPQVTEAKNIVTANPDGNFNRGSYVIKHYRDFINEAIKASDEREFNQNFTPLPLRGVTPIEFPRALKDKPMSVLTEDYDYESQFHKDVLDRFVDNFNQNGDRFKVDFPVLYNSSVVHMKTPDEGKIIASSRAFMKRLYDGSNKSSYYSRDKPYDPNCENITVELSPAYELHYYVPEEEEKEMVEPKAPVTLHYGYRQID